MKNHRNYQKSSREYKVYIHRLKTWAEVTEEQYYTYYREIWSTRKRAQAHGQCMCPKSKIWICDGDCLACEFRAAGDCLSLDYTYLNKDGDNFTMLDSPNNESVSIEEIATAKIDIEQLLSQLDEIMPEARRIGELRLAGLTDTEISKLIGISRTTFLSRIKRAAKILEADYSDMF